MAATPVRRPILALLVSVTAAVLVAASIPSAPAIAQAPDLSVNILRADYFTNYSGDFVHLEAKVGVDDPDIAEDLEVVATWPGGSVELSDFEDAGEYLYHRTSSPVPVDAPPAGQTVTVSVEGGGSDTQAFREWLPGAPAGEGDDRGRPYQEGFVDEYLDAVEITERIEELAAEFPDLAEIVELPNETNGYRRKAQALFEPPPPRLTVDAPSSAAGDYAAAAASFGPPTAAGGVAGDIVLVDDGSGAPSEGCGTLVGFPAGAVALADRGGCNFTQKVLAAQAAGAVAVIVANNQGGPPTAMGGNAPGITIPAVMISQDDGAALKAGLPASGRVVAPALDPSRFTVESLAWGHEGGNDLSVELVEPDGADSALSVEVEGDHITVSLATDAGGELTSTAADVVAALNDGPADGLVRAFTFRGNDGDGVVSPEPPTSLSDFLEAPDSIPRDPATVKMIRIGKHRDGSKTGVFAYSQEHAREWQTPLMALETAERLLRNYRTDAETRRLVNGLDIFIIPTVNPDGTNYSIYDNAAQRKNMTNHCPDALSDPLLRDNWGVDLNRNHDVGSRDDGFAGASFSCTSDVYAGPSELSEPEARNVQWVADTFDNIKFSMNIHSHGGYFMWSPGAYVADGREPLERPSLGVEDYFFEASERVLGEIKTHRGTVIHPGRTGPTSDVLYSAAGNSADALYYKYGIIAWNFELGAQIWNGSFWSTPQAAPGNLSGFQPTFPEARDQAMEFASGLIEMMAVALDYQNDRRAPSSDLVVVDGDGETVEFTFTASEPATIYYTTDGRRPGYSSQVLEAEYIRDEAETITVPAGTTVSWFAVDIAGNVERSYDPAGSRGRSYRREVVRP